MTTTTSDDPGVDHDRTRAALRAAVPRLAGMLRAVGDRDAPSGIPPWTVSDTGVHVSAVYLAYCSAFTGESPDLDRVLPAGISQFRERITAVNAAALALIGSGERGRLGDIVAERGERFLRATEGLAPDAPVATPWYGQHSVLSLATATGLMLNETVLHGLDIARGARLPWTIAPEEARLVLGQTMPAMMPLTLDREKAKGVRIAFDLAIRGGPRLAIVVDGGTATVTRDAPPRTYDCRITAAPTAFLLLSFRRAPMWKLIARGQIRGSGRKPWLAPRLRDLFRSP